MVRVTSAAAPTARTVTTGRSVRRAPRGGVVRTAGPTWFVTVMGTGIVANALALAPVEGRAVDVVATTVWLIAVALLGLVTVTTVRGLRAARADGAAPPAGPGAIAFWGTVPMAVTTVGSGALLAAEGLLGSTVASAVAAVLVAVGVVLGVLVAVAVPRAWIRRDPRQLTEVAPVWLLAVVPPMVSAAAIGGIAIRDPSGPFAAGLLAVAALLFAGSLAACLGVGSLVVARVIVHGTGPTAAAPTVLIVLGPLGQSITAACLLGPLAVALLPEPYGPALDGVATGYGLVALALAALWAIAALVVVGRAIRRGLPFALTWWSFTFPVGTCATGTALLADRVAGGPLTVLALVLVAVLIVAWATVLLRTAVGVLRGWAAIRPGSPRRTV